MIEKNCYLAFSLSVFSNSFLKCLIISNSSAHDNNFAISERSPIIVASTNQKYISNTCNRSEK